MPDPVTCATGPVPGLTAADGVPVICVSTDQDTKTHSGFQIIPPGHLPVKRPTQYRLEAVLLQKLCALALAVAMCPS